MRYKVYGPNGNVFQTGDGTVQAAGPAAAVEAAGYRPTPDDRYIVIEANEPHMALDRGKGYIVTFKLTASYRSC